MMLMFSRITFVIGVVFIVFSCAGNSSEQEVARLFESASKAELANKFDEAINTYERIIANYPDYPNLDKAYFMIGFIKSETLKQKQEALTYFQTVLDKYPQSELVDDAEFMVKTIEMDTDALTAFQQATGQ